MMKLSRVAVAITAVGLLAACAATTAGPEGPGATRETSLGEVFTDAKGMTLYTYDEDAPGKSNCNNLCATFWPPLEAADDARPHGSFSVITRDNGSKQWAYKDQPLYGYIRDSAPGDTTGDGADGVWHVAKP